MDGQGPHLEPGSIWEESLLGAGLQPEPTGGSSRVLGGPKDGTRNKGGRRKCPVRAKICLFFNLVLDFCRRLWRFLLWALTKRHPRTEAGVGVNNESSVVPRTPGGRRSAPNTGPKMADSRILSHFQSVLTMFWGLCGVTPPPAPASVQ